ncbi:mannose-1-phosphate guanylyltransferase/mannose-6-phosphate isomerase [Pandoraea apista]|uniref:mannose-1-phosphate guanylyltransferase/mannose-6-phosphate isomerase n=1 Tax=Pandoraea apista TaxID=93218 RepID=UPI00058A95D1|nr:mannose-1-phosphate guanylyltransferase/mannose-6-phosphate isomerase [Pandoraea apista]AJE98125.1 mannose-1-phosphate guanyltransferase [Pandoraea apista]AKH72137.1 mannose-1-phosphate guanyltransferase [Pandoraea apista]AKI60568.1 mannose-1-phosphate guanyltransferase [Pandoraea apista]AVF38708.1 mannose-1-phosphate guanylyltransferase/mannose-6-phosphate isomerase [Pandoraea apista]
MISVSPVILCGGSGSRLWPLSRAGFPKQFLCLTGDETLFQQSVERLAAVASSDVQVSAPLIVSNEAHRFLVTEQLRELGVTPEALLLEPEGRNTAPALTLAALAALESGDDPVLVMTPSDHTVADQAAFAQTVRRAIALASTGDIVILGITPDKPETGFGYIRVETANAEASGAFCVEQFVEKPSLENAQRYLDEGCYYWNSGMFVLRASVWMRALETFRSDIAESVRQAWQARSIDGDFIRPDKKAFVQIQGESIDYAVMERCPGSEFPVRMVALGAGWNDLGAWSSVWDVASKDEAGNAHLGDVVMVDNRNTLVHATSRLVGVVGVDNLIVVETPDAVLVMDKSRCQDVKQIVSTLIDQDREEHSLHRKVHRPWGWYDSVDEGQRFKVKRIQVKPKSSLSLQKHHHRAEHWVVVSGTAEITVGSTTFLLSENQSTYIPLGEVHRLHNPGTIPLEIIEVQSGAYLGEDDIVRLEDGYGRVND